MSFGIADKFCHLGHYHWPTETGHRLCPYRAAMPLMATPQEIVAIVTIAAATQTTAGIATL